MALKKKWITLVVSIVVIVAVGVGLFLWFHKTSAAVTYKTSAASKGTLVSTVSGTGNVVVSSSASITPSISGTIANVKVAVGDYVKAGQTLFTITNADLDVTVSKAYTTLLQAKQKLTQAKSDYTAAKESYTSLKSGSVTQAQLAYDQAQQNLAEAQVQLQRDQDTLQKDVNENTLVPGTHSAAEINLAEQTITVDQATITLKTNAVTTAKSDLAKAKAATGSDVISAKSKMDGAQITVQASENDVKAAELDYTNQKDTAAERTVTAPINGTVTTLNVKNGDELGSSGSGNNSSNASNSSASSSASVVIQDLTSLKAVISINEVDIASVKVGQKVSMTFDAISSLTLTGKVEKVDTVGTTTSGVVSYSATIGFDALDAKVKPEMSVNATITTEVKQNVLSVSSSAIKTSGTSHYVQILKNGSPVQQTVEIGSSSDTATEITSGLSEGDEVITQTIKAGQTNTNTSSSNSRGTGSFGVQTFTGGGEFRGPGG